MESVREAYDIEADRITHEFFRDRVAELFADAAVWIVESGMHQYGDGHGGAVYEMLHDREIAKGGGDEMENLRTLCRPCNSRKGAR